MTYAVRPNLQMLSNVCQAWSGILDCSLKYSGVQSGTVRDCKN